MARGRVLSGPAGPGQRPTSDRVREAVFDMLASLGGVAGWSVVDLFAGTGAMGVEALSRGAASVVFVERDEKALGVLRRNVAHVSSHLERDGLVTPGEGPRIVKADVMSYVENAGSFDLALCDPPYAFDLWERLLGSVRARLVVIESNRDLGICRPGWRIVRRRRHGLAVVHVLEATGIGARAGGRSEGMAAVSIAGRVMTSPLYANPAGTDARGTDAR